MEKVNMKLTLLLLLLPCTAFGNWSDWHYTGQNIALSRTTMQYPGRYENRYASLAVDGNNSSDARYCSHTDMSQNEAYWKVTFEQSYHLKGVVIVNRNPEVHRLRLRKFHMYGDNDMLLYQSNDESKTCNAYENNEVCAPLIFIPLTPRIDMETKSLKISVHARDNPNEHNKAYLTLCEVFVFADVACPLVPIKNGQPLPKSLTTTMVKCDTGYRASAAIVTCLNTGYWSEIPKCIPYCVWHVDNGYIVDYYNSKRINSPLDRWIKVRCHVGYWLGNMVTDAYRCTFNEGWNTPIQSCVPVTCQCPSLDFGFYEVKTNLRECDGNENYDTVIVPKCRGGYNLESNTERKCTDGPQWSGNTPRCVRMKCNNPGNITNGYYQPNSNVYQYNDIINAYCHTGYKLKGSIMLECSEHGRWSGMSPVCEIVICRKPSRLIDGYYMRPDQTQTLSTEEFKFNTTVVPHCNSGFYVINFSIRACDSTGNWNGIEPKCERIHCPVMQTSDHVFKYSANHTIVDQNIIYINTSVYLECKAGFYSTSSRTLQMCLLNGSLSEIEPRCSKVVCAPSAGQVKRVITGIPVTVVGPIYYNENRNVSVNDSLFLHEGGDLIVYCAANGSLVWSSTGPPTLRPVCPLITLIHGWTNHTCTSENWCEAGKSVNITCKRGYSAAQGTATCTSNHTWSNRIYCQANKGSVSDSQVAVVGGASGGAGVLLIALLAAAGFVIYRRYKGSKNKTERNEGSSSQNRDQPNVYSEIGATESAFVLKGDSEYVYATNSTKTTCLNNDFEEKDTALIDKTYYDFDMQERMPNTAIKIDNLYDAVLSPIHLEEMKIQFKEFPKGLTDDYYEALKIQNRPKNRYKNIYPYDATRVILQKDEQHCTDYINASLIHGYTQSGEFVAAQGPTKEILVDFWRMVWQLRIGKIVMLTKLKEDKKMKCVQYWPDEGSIEYDNFKITHRSTELFSDFVIRKLALQKDGEEERMVYHFHFTSWPDKSVPQYASSLVHFRQKIFNGVVKDKCPMIVHCSAGVGRTGTFIALNILTEQASTMGYVDPVGCVNTLRRQRVDMVQTPDQYIFLHMALLETLMLSTSALPASNFLRAYEELLSFDKDRRKLDVQFSRMEKMSPVADECQYVSAKDVRNRNKNRYSNILPVADHMPHLTPSGKRSEPDYINAVFLPGYKKKGAFIVTQTPLEVTKTDFWRLVVEHDVHTIVMMNNRSEMKEDEIYWPENESSETYDNMTIAKTFEECEGCLRKITLDLNRFGKTRKLQQIQFEHWLDDSALPSSPKSVINLLDAVQYWQHQSGNKPVLVHCMNGADRSGLFCVASVVLERMKIEQDVAITHVIKEMRNYREHIIPSLEQFQFVHEVVKEYILQNEIYSNFTD